MRPVSVALGAAAAIAALTFVPPTSTAYAGLLRCTGNTLLDDDLHRARREAERIGADRKFDWKSASVCTKGNYASVWVEAPPELQEDGSVHHPHVRCERPGKRWSCEIEVARTLTVRPNLNGKLRDIDIHLPLEFDVDVARTLMQRAVDIAPTLQVIDACGYVSDRAGTTSRRLEALRSTYAFNDAMTGRPRTEIVVWGGKPEIEVEADGYLLVFGQGEFKCWDIRIVVS